MCGSDILLGLLAIIFPPLAVWVKRGICSADSLINILLCCLAYLPGLLHAWYIISITPDPTYERVAQHDAEQGGTITYYYVQTNGSPQYAPQGQRQHYGTVNASAPNAQFPKQPTRSQPQPAPAAVHPSSTQQAGPSGGEDAPPPSYQQATGDNKVQGP